MSVNIRNWFRHSPQRGNSANIGPRQLLRCCITRNYHSGSAILSIGPDLTVPWRRSVQPHAKAPAETDLFDGHNRL